MTCQSLIISFLCIFILFVQLQLSTNETSNSTRLIKFYPSYPTQPQLFHSTQPVALYPTQHTLSNSSRYAHPSQKIQTRTKQEHHHQLHRLKENDIHPSCSIQFIPLNDNYPAIRKQCYSMPSNMKIRTKVTNPNQKRNTLINYNDSLN